MKIKETPKLDILFDRAILHIVLDKGEKEAAAKCVETYDEKKVYDLKIEQRRKKRSLNANAYHWVLVGKIAEVLNVSNAEVHNQLLIDYGKPLFRDGEPEMVLMKDDNSYLRFETYHVAPTDVTENRDGIMYRWYYQLKPSHLYDTKEMARLIDGTVYEAKELGIETMTPDQILEMTQKWSA